MVQRILALALLASTLLGLTGCGSRESEDPNRVSSIPWNRPQPWEGQGPLGGFGQPGRGGPGGSY